MGFYLIMLDDFLRNTMLDEWEEKVLTEILKSGLNCPEVPSLFSVRTEKLEGNGYGGWNIQQLPF